MNGQERMAIMFALWQLLVAAWPWLVRFWSWPMP